MHLEGLQYVLLVGHRDAQVGGDDVRQAAGILDAPDREVDLGRNLLVELDVAIEEIDDASHQGLEFRRSLDILLKQGHLDPQVRLDLDEAFDDGPR